MDIVVLIGARANVATLLHLMHERNQKRKTIKMEGKDCDGGKLPKTKSGEAVSFHDYKLKSSLIYFFVGNVALPNLTPPHPTSPHSAPLHLTILYATSHSRHIEVIDDIVNFNI